MGDNFLSVLAAPFKFQKRGNLISESLKSGHGMSWCVGFSWKEGGGMGGGLGCTNSMLLKNNK